MLGMPGSMCAWVLLRGMFCLSDLNRRTEILRVNNSRPFIMDLIVFVMYELTFLPF